VRRLISAHLDVGPGVAVPESSPGDLQGGLLLPQRLVQVDDVRLHAGDLLDRLEVRSGLFNIWPDPELFLFIGTDIHRRF